MRSESRDLIVPSFPLPKDGVEYDVMECACCGQELIHRLMNSRPRGWRSLSYRGRVVCSVRCITHLSLSIPEDKRRHD
jgi:hypothetical protein